MMPSRRRSRKSEKKRQRNDIDLSDDDIAVFENAMLLSESDMFHAGIFIELQLLLMKP